MTVAISPTFRRQLNALLKVRRTIDRTHRQQAPTAWLWKQLLVWGLAIAFVGMAFLGGWVIAIDDRVDRARAGVLFLFAPTTAVGYLLVAQMRDSSGGGHPIGEDRKSTRLNSSHG